MLQPTRKCLNRPPALQRFAPLTSLLWQPYQAVKVVLDVGIVSPDATGAGPDCCEAMFQKKLRTHEPYLEELERQHIRHIPLAFSTYGRVSPEASATPTCIAQRAARRKGLVSHRGIPRRAMAGIGVQLWRSATAMTSTCLPRATPEGIIAIFGDGFDGESHVSSDEPSEVESTTASSQSENLSAFDESGSDIDLGEDHPDKSMSGSGVCSDLGSAMAD